MFHKTKNCNFPISQARTTQKSSELEAVGVLGPGPGGFVDLRLGQPCSTWKAVPCLEAWMKEDNIPTNPHPTPVCSILSSFLIFGERFCAFPCHSAFIFSNSYLCLK